MMGYLREEIAFWGETIPLYYLSGYRGVSAGLDGISKSILKFKQGDPRHVEVWGDVALLALREAGLRREDMLVRALGHQETAILARAAPKPMDVLCKSVERLVGCGYVPELLQKKWRTTKLTGLSRFERERELEKVYGLGPVFGWCHKCIWVMDDVVTTGVTVRAIATVLRKRYPNVNIRAFSLSRTDAHPGGRDMPQPKGDHHAWDKEGFWKVMEEEVEYGDGWLPTVDNLSCPVFGNGGTFFVGD